MEMEDDEEMSVQVYDVVEVDFDYEFDAARFFDFTTPESDAQARLSELWFLSAPDYPPSPFVAKMFPMEGIFSQNVSPKSKYGDYVPLVYDDADVNQESHYYQDVGHGAEGKSQPSQTLKASNLLNSQNLAQELFGGQSLGLSFYNHMANDLKKTKTKSLAKPYMPRSSTLMKPTASQLAKQNQRRQAVEFRLQKSEDSSSSLCGVENQASKRQKLDGGVLRRIVDVKQPSNLIHKTPKKDVLVQGMNIQSKLRITIPREPHLETAHRAERIRYTINKDIDKPTATTNRFEARPLIRKGANRANTARILGSGNKDGNRCDPVDAPKLECQPSCSFKARPLDRKILTSRGDLGVFRNSKRDVTVPKDFEFQTAKRNQQNPPVELFSKLSLACEPQPKSCAQPQLSQRTCNPYKKEFKENRWQSCRQGQNINLQTSGTHDNHSEANLNTVNGAASQVGLKNGTSRAALIWRQ